ncbi:MAG: carboxypeptidase-like regulatory domain-containing protein [Saprospiraceae bacterium]|nr:carboxypeptidase-like regulatory domain-containing protein [Saprospiraceae bacterium]
MKTIQKLCAFFAILLSLHLQAQPGIETTIEGRILDQKTGNPIAYANIYNKRTQKGTISNLDGYFKLLVERGSDTLVVSFLGYQSILVLLTERKSFYEVFLQESAQLLSEVTVKPGDDGPLYELIRACKNNQLKRPETSKVYYGLKSYVDETQVELVECFYNGTLAGYDLDALYLKTGRFALQPKQQRFFISKESSRAISMLKLLDDNAWFPVSPLSLSTKQLKKSYYMDLLKQYRDENRDSVVVLNFVPKDSSGTFFTAQLWVNETQKYLMKVELSCLNATRHPFLPLFQTDSINQVALQITRTFAATGGQAHFQHIDFGYKVIYKSRDKKVYQVATNAVLYAYDFGKAFWLPKFEFTAEVTDDFRKINAMPYQAYFWENNQELKLNDQQNQNEQFFNSPGTMTNQTAFSKNAYTPKGILEHPYVFWTRNRLSFTGQYELEGASGNIAGKAALEKPYRISIKLFLDATPLAGQMHTATATVFDPLSSYYRLPVTDTVLCFVNLYFDLMELERRALEEEIRQSDQSIHTIERLYEARLIKIEDLSRQYFEEVERGEKKKGLKKWNDLVKSKLGIDNIEFFKLYQQTGE